ncbi:MAG: response regulator transcription factor [Acidimicrobiales bacterium]|nr:response regulator transcription factor [Acidimicrobiales bacterium]
MTAAPSTQSKTIRVVIVDDHDVVALGLRALLEDEDDIEVLDCVHSVAEAATAARNLNPDVILMDYRLPDGTGADATRQVRAAPAPPTVVMVTSAADRRVLNEALEAGCAGFVSKNADRQDLVSAVRAAAHNDSYFTRDMLNHLVHLRRFDQIDNQELSSRECDVLQLTANGLNPDEIASRLYLSPHTVKNHLRHAMSKLDAHTKLDAVVKAIRARLISIDEAG